MKGKKSMERPGSKELASIKAIKLPTLPGIAMKIIEVMQRESPSIKEIAEIISCDPSLSAKILQTVNSPFYGLPTKIGGVNQAIAFIGLNAVKNLALGFSLIKTFKPKKRVSFDHIQFWKDSLTGAVAAKTIADRVNRTYCRRCIFFGAFAEYRKFDHGRIIAGEIRHCNRPDESRINSFASG